MIYDVEWLKEHFNTTEAKLYGQPNEDCISRQAVLDSLHNKFADGFDSDKWWNSISVLNAINETPSVIPQPKTEQESFEDCIRRAVIVHAKTAHWEWVQYDGNPNIGNWHCSVCRSIVVEHVPKSSVDGIPLYKYCPQCGTRIIDSGKR